jgi:signal transduction histidine kinase
MSNLIDESLYQLVEVMSSPAFLLNSSGMIHYANHAGLVYFGQPSQAMMGRNLDDMFSTSTREWRRRVEDVMATGQAQTWDIPDGQAEPRPMWTADLVPWPDHLGRTQCIVMLLEAASEQIPAREDQARLITSQMTTEQSLRSRFVSMASHEFRTPLSVIYSSAELLEHFGAQWPIEKQRKHVKRIQAQVRHMINLLDDATTIDRIDAGRVMFSPMPIDLVQVCRKWVDEVQQETGADHRIAVNFQGMGTTTVADEQLLRYILLNLLSNAVTYSPPASLIRLAVSCQAEYLALSVQDEGIGIPAADRPHVFERFQRGGNVRHIPGTGLGLSIVKDLVDLYGGSLQLDSELQQGTTVSVTLPVPDHGAAQTVPWMTAQRREEQQVEHSAGAAYG